MTYRIHNGYTTAGDAKYFHYDTPEEAQQCAEEIFQSTGVVVGITAHDHKKRPEYSVNRCYTMMTPDDDASDPEPWSGFVFENRIMTRDEAIEELKDCSELSVCPVSGPESLTGHEWASTSYEQDFRTGVERQESVHILRSDNTCCTPRELFSLFQAAGLAGVRS